MRAIAACLGAISVCCGILTLYPYFIYPAMLRGVKSIPPAAHDDQEPSSDEFAILFCAFNEGEVANAKIRNLELIRRHSPDVEILCYDDGSTDGSAQAFAARSDLLTVVFGAGRKGKAHGMKELVARTERKYLIFTDANVMLSQNIVDKTSSHFRDASVGGLCGHLEYQNARGTATERVGGKYWRLEERIKAAESRTGNVMGGDGSIFSIRRSLYPQYLDSVQDDFTVTMSVVFQGFRLIYAPDVVAYEELVASSREEYRRKVRIAARAYHTHGQMLPALRHMSVFDRWKYASHKLLRWYSGAFAAGALSAAYIVALLVSPTWAFLFLVFAGGGLSLPVVRRDRRVSPIFAIGTALWATLNGVLLARKGRTFAVWNPPARGHVASGDGTQ